MILEPRATIPPGPRHASPRSHLTADPGQRLPGGDRVVVVDEPFGEYARLVRGHLDRSLPGADLPDRLAGPDLGALDELGERRERTGGGGDHDPELRGRLAAG